MNRRLGIFAGCVWMAMGAPGAFADTVLTRDGVVRVGVIEARDDEMVRLRVDDDGISGVMEIPMGKVEKIVLGGAVRGSVKPATPGLGEKAGSGASAGGVGGAGGTMPATGEVAGELGAYVSRGFMVEMVAGAAGNGLDDVRRLPAKQHEFWDRATEADAGGKWVEALEALRQLEAGMRELPGGSERLDAMSRRARKEGFGAWMGRVHWAVIGGKYATGQFDLSDVRGAERPVLIGILKGKTAAVLEPLRGYFPMVDGQVVVTAPATTAQLAGITVSNALEVKEQSALAAAVLLGQLKLEPEMAGVDRAFLGAQLGNVNRILARARDLEPLAKAAQARAERERVIAEEKAQREAAAQKAVKSK